MNEKIKIIIDGKKIEAKAGQTVLEAAEENGIDIPALCHHPDLKVKASCRVCVVEIKGKKGLHASCSTKVADGMEIITDSEDVKRARKINLELICAQHIEECSDCVWNARCQLLNLAKKNDVKITRFVDRKTDYPTYQFDDALIFDSSKCIDCRNCVEVCKAQGVGFLEVKEEGTFFKIVPSDDPKKDCVYCGQCIMSCSAGAFEGVGEFED
ncbi:MAG: (2Fe-2S)-binding protein, partial [Candidatus Pacebacteria bacterium]|nr:(2Fe-2S)-binding protein [Candidatus Paceibacterota bacterium]